MFWSFQKEDNGTRKTKHTKNHTDKIILSTKNSAKPTQLLFEMGLSQ